MGQVEVRLVITGGEREPVEVWSGYAQFNRGHRGVRHNTSNSEVNKLPPTTEVSAGQLGSLVSSRSCIGSPELLGAARASRVSR